MKKPPLIPGTTEQTEIQFYEALQAGDIDRLMACWADEEDVICIHPDGGRWLGLPGIRAAFKALMVQAGAVRVVPEQTHVVQAGLNRIHSVIERITVDGDAGSMSMLVLATHVYQPTPMGWRLLLRHASWAVADQIFDQPAQQTLH